ncbi:MAG TPA: alpha/beta hydrolase [Candidatus Gallimonas gallistercoris]|uniref:Alpha/beta hydrolase n=1 Tax=Candidatus Gallimonas gallistercoris TaxID=2838602 RepID=A0A9D2H0R4_9FIRM|nr:alpha/beta hydrolase [Candidatus Gallimonas gallistercoris]
MNSSFLQQGGGKDLVFLHGYLSSKESFYPQINYFSRHFRVTAPDLPGFGGSGTIPAAWSVGEYADWLEGFLKERGIAFPHVIAHSFGGRVAIKCLARGLIDRAVLTGCAGIVKRLTLSYHLKVKSYRLVKKFAPRFAEAKFGSAEYRSLSPLMRESYKKIVNEDLREEAKRIARPVLYLNGERDRETPLSSVKILHECTAGSRLAVLKGCGHFAHLDEPLLFNLAAEEFLNDA